MTSAAAIARTWNVVQVEIERRAAVPEFVTISGMEDRLQRGMFAEWAEKAEAAITATLDGAPATLTREWLASVPAHLEAGFKGWPSDDLVAMTREVVEETYRLSAQVIARKRAGVDGYDRELRLKAAAFDLAPSFSTADRDAMGYLAQSQVFWLGEHYEEDTVEDIRRAGWVELAGRSGKDAGTQLRRMAEDRFGVGAFDHKGRAYFEGVAVNAATTARVTGSLLQMRDLQVTTYVFMAVLDERTTEVCQHMDGKSFSVTEATDRIDQMVASRDPRAVRDLHGWDPGGFLERLAGEGVHPVPGQDLTAGDASKVMRAGFAFPPLHFRCRSTVDIGFSEGTEPVEVRTGPKPGEFPWDPAELKVSGDGGKDLGGVNAKVLVTAPDGSRWLFKPYTHRGEQDAYRAYADKLAADVAKSLGHPTAEVYVTTLPQGHAALDAMGRVGSGRPILGSIQRWTEDVIGAVGETPLKELTKDQLLSVQKEHLLDWLISNHDGHRENVLLRADGSVLGIDKGQAFKFYGRDRLHWSYQPNKGGPFHGPYFAEQSEKYAAGEFGRRFVLKGPDDNPELLAFLEKVRDMPDDQFLAMIRPYSSRAASAGIRWGGMDEDAFLRSLLERKRAIVDDARGYYKDLNGARKVALPPIQRKPKAPPVVTPIDDAFLKDVDASGWEGRSLLVRDTGNVRAGNLLVHGMDGDGTVIEAQLTEAGDAALKAALGSSIPTQVSRVVTAAPPDQFHDPALKVVKSLVAHLATPGHSVFDGKVTDQTWKDLKEMKGVLDLFSKPNVGDAAAREVAAHYANQLRTLLGDEVWATLPGPNVAGSPTATQVQAIADAVKAAKAKGFQFTRHAPTPSPSTPAAASTPTRWKVRLVDTSERRATTRNGRIVYEGDEGEKYGGKSWEITTATNPRVRILYAPHEGNLASKQGRFRVHLDTSAKELTAADLDVAFEAVRDLGIGTDLARPIDVEAEYLRKVTRVAKLDVDRTAIQGISNTDKLHDLETVAKFRTLPNQTPEEVVNQLSAAWAERLGVKDIRRLKEYDPTPQNPGGRGWARWFRFDVSDKDLDGYTLNHHLHRGDAREFFERALTGSGARALISTETKLRIGIPIGGMSPEEDMRTGGATGVFLRIHDEKKTPIQVGNIRFDRRILRDTDNLVYDQDRYGRSDAATVASHHFGALDRTTLRKIAANRDSNETIPRQAVPWDFISGVGVRNREERDRLIATLRGAGIEKFGDRPIEDVIQVAGY